MDNSWIKIYNSYDLNELEIIRSFLIEKQIEAVIINKQDSMYVTLNSFSPVELFVQKDDVIKAKYYISKQFNNE
jgi:hypothetical protein